MEQDEQRLQNDQITARHVLTGEENKSVNDNEQLGTEETVSSITHREELCIICLTSVDSSTRGVTAGCLHGNYHFHCLLQWLENKGTCPLCKTKVEYVKHGFEVESKKFKKYFITPNNPEQSRGESSRTRQRARQQAGRSRRRTEENEEPNGVDDSILRRRYIYKHRLRSLHVGNNRISKFSNVTPQIVRANPDLESKAKSWIRRELEIFEWTNGNREWLLEYILAIVKTMNLRSADGSAEELLSEFFGKDFAGVFLHDLYAFLRSPFPRVRDFDRWAQYPEPIPRFSNGDIVDIGPESLDARNTSRN